MCEIAISLFWQHPTLRRICLLVVVFYRNYVTFSKRLCDRVVISSYLLPCAVAVNITTVVEDAGRERASLCALEYEAARSLADIAYSGV